MSLRPVVRSRSVCAQPASRLQERDSTLGIDAHGINSQSSPVDLILETPVGMKGVPRMERSPRILAT